MLVVLRFDRLGGSDEEAARSALDALAGCPGFVRGWLARGLDDPEVSVLALEWAGVGTYRRALAAHHVRLTAGPFLARARDEPSAFEPLLLAGPDGVRAASTDRADDADSVRPGEPMRGGVRRSGTGAADDPDVAAGGVGRERA